jgi:hypothetical protein
VELNAWSWSKDLTVEVAGHGVVSHAGSAVLRLLADNTGLTGALSKALRRRGFTPVHDRGRVLVDTAVCIADGGRVLSDLAALRDQGELYGPVASDPTLWRALEEIGADQRAWIATARAKIRRQVWALIEARHGGIPASQVADVDLGPTVVIRMDATIQIAHSDKEQATGTFKGTYGHHPLTAWCDNTGESLTFLLRPGRAGSNTASDHITVLTEAIAQIPPRRRRDLLVTVDGAGATLELIRHISTLNTGAGRRVHYSVGFDLDARARAAIAKVTGSDWQHVSDRDGEPRDLDDAGVVELTGLLRASVGGDELRNWPADMRIICRRERPSAGAQLCALEETDGWRYQLFATNTGRGQLAFLEAPPSCARPRGGLHPLREGHRPRSSPLDLNDDQSGVVCGRDHRRGPAVLATAAVPGPIPGRRRTQNAALPHPAHRGPAGPRPTQTEDQNPADLALGPRARGRVPDRVRPDRPDLSTDEQHHPRPSNPPASGTGATRRDRRASNHDQHPN